MSLTRSIAALITDGSGAATNEFLTTLPEHWASTQMGVRYGQIYTPLDGPNHPATLCYKYLLDEYRALKGWFQNDNKFSALLSSRFLQNYMNRPLGDGIGWDFKTSGDPEPLMVSFKTQLISAHRAIEAMPSSERFDSGNMAFGGIRTLVRAAYTTRARMHSWRSRATDNKDYTGIEIQSRWISIQTFVFLIRAGIDPSWAWDSSKCKGLFGPFDEERMIMELGASQ